MIDPMKHFLWILKITHGGGSMDSAMDFAHGVLPGDLQYEIRDMLDNRDAPWVPNKIVELRERLAGVWKYGPDCNRDVVLLDIAMEKFYRQRIEATNTAGMPADDKLGALEAAVRNVCIGGDFDRMQMALEFLRKANGPAEGRTVGSSGGPPSGQGDGRGVGQRRPGHGAPHGRAGSTRSARRIPSASTRRLTSPTSTTSARRWSAVTRCLPCPR